MQNFKEMPHFEAEKLGLKWQFLDKKLSQTFPKGKHF